MPKIRIENEYETCGYTNRTYYESDTGYSEYECTLLNVCCEDCCDICPLSFTYEVIEDE